MSSAKGRGLEAVATMVELDFSEFYEQSVKNALHRALGESAAKSVLFHTGFEDKRSPSEFHRMLLSMLAEGAYAIERSMIRKMFARLCAYAPHTDPTLISCYY